MATSQPSDIGIAPIADVSFIGHTLHVNGKPITIRSPDLYDPKLKVGNTYFETPDEVVIAKLLRAQGVGHIHHPRFQLLMPDGTYGVWSPDFFFCRPRLIMLANPCRCLPIHGLEVKHLRRKPHVKLRQKLLAQQHNVYIHILYHFDVQAFLSTGSIPLQTFNLDDIPAEANAS